MSVTRMTRMRDVYKNILTGYPDILDVKQISLVLNVSTKTVYKLLGEGTLESLKVGREFRVPKVSVMRYLLLIPEKA